MKIRTSYITTLLATGAAAFAIAAAPTALADTTTGMSCDSTNAGSECQTPGNVQIDDAPPPVAYSPYGDMGLLLGVGGGGHR